MSICRAGIVQPSSSRAETSVSRPPKGVLIDSPILSHHGICREGSRLGIYEARGFCLTRGCTPSVDGRIRLNDALTVWMPCVRRISRCDGAYASREFASIAPHLCCRCCVAHSGIVRDHQSGWYKDGSSMFSSRRYPGSLRRMRRR